MFFLLSILEGFIPAIIIISIYELIKDPEHMEDYEKEFIAAHDHEQFDLILSGFDNEDSKLLLHLCKQHLSLEKLKKRPPKVEWHHIDFKKAVHLPFLVEVIRCSGHYAIIKAPGTKCAYLLRRGKSNPNIGDVMFFFKAKFCYYVREPSSEEVSLIKQSERKNSVSSISDVGLRSGDNSSDSLFMKTDDHSLGSELERRPLEREISTLRLPMKFQNEKVSSVQENATTPENTLDECINS